MFPVTTNCARCYVHLRLAHLCRRAGITLLFLPWMSALLLATVVFLSACGSGDSSSKAQNSNQTLAGNWQFTTAPPPDGSFVGGLQGGFLLQTNDAITGSAAYAVSLPLLPYPCNSGSSQVSGTMSGQGVSLTAIAGSQTFTFNGILSFDGSTVTGTYASTAGTAGDGSPCGTAQSGLQWSAVLVPPITGPIQGNFHSTGGVAGLVEQDFVVSGGLFQAANTGASSAAVTGNLSFLNPTTNLRDYPCLTSASVSGQVSGDVINLQIVGADGSIVGEIGELLGSNGVTGVNPVTVVPATGGVLLNGDGPSYIVATNSCPQSASGELTVADAGDYGNICLALGSTSACQQPITLTPSALTFSPQVLGTPPVMQTITLADASSGLLGGLTLALSNNGGAANFSETDTCGVNGNPALGQPFNLISGQPCLITITFAPLETCAVGIPPSQCPSPLVATLTVTSPSNDMMITVPITGTGVGGDAGADRSTGSDAVRVLPNSSNRSSLDAEHHATIE